MRLENATGLPAQLFRTIVGQDRIAAALVARVTYDLREGKLERSDEQPWIVSPGPWEGPEGPMGSDEVLYRGGVDLIVFGQAWTPRARPEHVSEVKVFYGDFRYTLLIFGERVWQNGSALTPTAPRSFVNLPLTLAHAFGGRRPWDGIEVAFTDNPDGKGYYLSKEDAVGGRLPNIEDPRFLVRRWSDAPAPAGVGLPPPTFGPRVREALVIDRGGQLKELKPSFFNAAFPAMVAPAARPGETLRLEGVDPDGPVDIVIPPSPFRTTLSFGSSTLDRVPAIDQIGVQVEKRRVFISYRYPFRYFINRHEPRACRLTLDRGV